MKIGDLVTLSSAGKKSQQNKNVLGLIGMIHEIKGQGTSHPYRITWIGLGRGGANGTNQLPMARYEIKKHRLKK